MPVPNSFANVTTSIPLSQLDANFNTPITLGNTAIQLGNTVSTLNNMTFANVTISSGTANLTTANATNLISSNVAITGGSITGITDLAIADGGTGASTKLVAFDNLSPLTTKGDLIGYDGADNVRLAVGTNGQVLTANSSSTTGLSWAAAGGGGSAFPSGTLMLFQQTSAPTGWTKQTTHDNKALRVVSGAASSGGSVAFTTAFASQTPAGTVGSTTLTTTQIPSHSHSAATPGSEGSGGTGFTYANSSNTGNAGGGGSHNHTFTGTAINLAVSYVDLIIASAN